MNPIILNPVELIDQTFLLIIGISVVIHFCIVVFMLFCLYKYDHSSHTEAAFIEGNLPLKFLTIIPV
jgi:heme/copper-type cytochrome/quinol oxidase subunit 2